jgi:hypothetical protein
VEIGNAESGRARHDRASRTWVAERIAVLQGSSYAGEFDPDRRYEASLYFVPVDTLTAKAANGLGIRSAQDLFGGVVPDAFVATKAIAHPLVSIEALAPAGWSHDFALRLQDAVLFGYSAYSLGDALIAAERVLERGLARVKIPHGIGGHGQFVLEQVSDAEALLEKIGPQAIAADGIVVEQHLDEVETFSVGRVRVGEAEASYWGRQRLTRNLRNDEVYGGSDLTVVRGGYDGLLELDLSPEVSHAVLQARIYESAAAESFPGFFASRCNYDIAHGRGGDGAWRSGVLEPSWRIGGASPAEIAALERLCEEPALSSVNASTFEVYGDCEVPPGALVQFREIDERVGKITKYCLLEADGSPARTGTDRRR